MNIDKNFQDAYIDKAAEVKNIVWTAKDYIAENWKKVNDWTQMDVTITVHHHEYGHENHSFRSKEVDLGDYILTKKPVLTVGDVLFDRFDGDMAIIINCRNFERINDGACVAIASYIHRQLNPEEYLNLNQDDERTEKL